MRRLVTIITLCTGCLLTASAQTFTQRIQQKGKSSEGTLTVNHDRSIDELVNKQPEGWIPPKKEEPLKTTPPPAKSEAKTETATPEQHRDTVSIQVQQLDTRRKVMRGGYKVNGYRVQAFAGGNQRKDRQKAEQVGSTIKSMYPDEPIYVHFYSPRWICRVGNYRTYEEAHEMLNNIRKLGISGASIVKEKITVSY